MSENIKILEPKAIWNHFANINAIPRASKKEEKIIQYMLEFGKKLGLDSTRDHIGNVIIKKPATAGMEDRQIIVMQSHLDMVHQKNKETEFDFTTEGSRMYVDGDWVKADGTTLGADNGIGVSTIMAVLSSDNIPHPAIEALFTIDEETGMTGAMELKPGVLTGTIMLNLDTEYDRELTIGCAGGIDLSATGDYKEEKHDAFDLAYRLKLKGASGGHSGMDIHLGRANANKIMNRLLVELKKQIPLRIASIDGGGLRNAIPRESETWLCIKTQDQKHFEDTLRQLKTIIQSEYKTTDPDITVILEPTTHPEKVLPLDFQDKLLKAIYACPNGIYRMSPEIDGLVQTSNNLARVYVNDGAYEILCLTRSSVESEKQDLVNALSSTFELLGAHVSTSGAYPGWRPNPDSDIVRIMENIYTDKFNETALVNACHAGLECGILGQNYPEMDMISFGPNIRGAHSPDERVQISSVQKFWDFLLETLKQIPSKN